MILLLKFHFHFLLKQALLFAKFQISTKNITLIHQNIRILRVNKRFCDIISFLLSEIFAQSVVKGKQLTEALLFCSRKEMYICKIISSFDLTLGI